MTTPALVSTPAAAAEPGLVAPEGGEAEPAPVAAESNVMQKVESHLSGILDKCGFMEQRAMEQNMKSHELVRMFMNVITGFKVDGDPEWVVRSVRDAAVMLVRRLHEVYSPLFAMNYVTEFGTFVSGQESMSFCSERIYMLIQVSLLTTMMLMIMTMMMMLMVMMI